jgi:hypothetical protein
MTIKPDLGCAKLSPHSIFMNLSCLAFRISLEHYLHLNAEGKNMQKQVINSIINLLHDPFMLSLQSPFLLA